jgi:hypothetical protein
MVPYEHDIPTVRSVYAENITPAKVRRNKAFMKQSTQKLGTGAVKCAATGQATTAKVT